MEHLLVKVTVARTSAMVARRTAKENTQDQIVFSAFHVTTAGDVSTASTVYFVKLNRKRDTV
jgi:hypothetical protein